MYRSGSFVYDCPLMHLEQYGVLCDEGFLFWLRRYDRAPSSFARPNIFLRQFHFGPLHRQILSHGLVDLGLAESLEP